MGFALVGVNAVGRWSLSVAFVARCSWPVLVLSSLSGHGHAMPCRVAERASFFLYRDSSAPYVGWIFRGSIDRRTFALGGVRDVMSCPVGSRAEVYRRMTRRGLKAVGCICFTRPRAHVSPYFGRSAALSNLAGWCHQLCIVVQRATVSISLGDRIRFFQRAEMFPSPPDRWWDPWWDPRAAWPQR